MPKNQRIRLIVKVANGEVTEEELKVLKASYPWLEPSVEFYKKSLDEVSSGEAILDNVLPDGEERPEEPEEEEKEEKEIVHRNKKIRFK